MCPNFDDCFNSDRRLSRLKVKNPFVVVNLYKYVLYYQIQCSDMCGGNITLLIPRVNTIQMYMLQEQVLSKTYLELAQCIGLYYELTEITF